MFWILAAKTTSHFSLVPFKIDVQKNPIAAILIAAGVCVGLWFLVGIVTRRDEQRAQRRRLGTPPPQRWR